MMEPDDQRFLNEVASELIKAEALVEKLRHTLSISRDMISLLLTRVHELTLRLPTPFDE